MDQIFANFFQNGQNAGEITILSSDGQVIKCHKTVFENTTSFQENIPTTIKVNHHSKYIKLALAQLYDSNYLLKNRQELSSNNDPETFSLDEKSRTAIAVIKIIDVAEDLRINYWADLVQKLQHSFERSISVDNWINIINRIIGIPKYKFLLQSMITKIEQFFYLTDPSKISPELMHYLFETHGITVQPFYEDGEEFFYLVNYTKREYIMVSRKNSWSQCHAIISVVIKHNIWKNSDDIEIEPFYNDAICKSKLDEEKYQDVSHHLTIYKQQRRLQ